MSAEVSLRYYQREAVDAVHKAVTSGVHGSGIALPTGTGKTIVFSKLIEERGYPALILAHRDELINQAIDKFQMVDPTTPCGIVKAGLHQADLPVVAASVQTLARESRLKQMPTDFKTVVVDEAHHAAADSYRRILKHFDDVECHAFVSATLERADRKALGSVIDEVVYAKTIMEMIEEGYLCDIRAEAVRVKGFNVNRLRVNRGDFQTSEVEEALHAAGASLVAVKAWQELAQDRKTIVFCPGVESSLEFQAAFEMAGISSTCVYGALDIDVRRERLAGFARGDYQVITNAMVLTEGYDEPTVDCVMVARPTRSKGLYIQMVGRGTRIFPGKSDLLVIDLVGSEERIDLVSVPKLMGLDPDKVKKDGVMSAARDKLDEPEMLARMRAGLAGRDIEIEHHEARLFDRRDVNWLRMADGSWVLSGAKGSLILVQEAVGWDAILRPHDRFRDDIVIAEGKDLALAMGMAEERVVRHADIGTMAILDKKASWRKGAPSEKQIGLLRKRGIPMKEGITKGEASDLIAASSAQMGGNRRRVRFEDVFATREEVPV